MKKIQVRTHALVVVGLWLASLAGGALGQAPEKPMISDPYRQGRSITMSQHGIVASSHGLASQAGLDILRAGGNAMDAAIATAATLGVVESHAIGIGGDAFFLYYEAATGKVYAYNGSGRSPRALPRSYFDAKDKPDIDDQSWEAVTVPGAFDAYIAGLERFGSKPLEELLEPAIQYAEEGWPIYEIVGNIWASVAGKLKKDRWSREIWLTDKGAPRVGSLFSVPAYAKTLRTLAAGGGGRILQGSDSRRNRPLFDRVGRLVDTGGLR